jgi:threonylcarbamoyladenosine tRNA methylthiotransferase CDKAL1
MLLPEIDLAGVPAGAYGRDIGSSIAELLQRCVAVLPADGRTMLRLGMTNPPFILEHLTAVAEVLYRRQTLLALLHPFTPLSGMSNIVI